jgi:hypothetical protein
MGSKLRWILSTPTERVSIRLKLLLCLASTGVNTPGTMFPNSGCREVNFLEQDLNEAALRRTRYPVRGAGDIERSRANSAVGHLSCRESLEWWLGRFWTELHPGFSVRDRRATQTSQFGAAASAVTGRNFCDIPKT